jgi:hypothetical protein
MLLPSQVSTAASSIPGGQGTVTYSSSLQPVVSSLQSHPDIKAILSSSHSLANKIPLISKWLLIALEYLRNISNEICGDQLLFYFLV